MEEKQSDKRLHLIVSGKVQGVFYRASTEEQAIKLGLVGYVQNLPSGKVEIVVQGDIAALEKLRDWAQLGPAQARVDEVESTWSDPTAGEFNDFAIRR